MPKASLEEVSPVRGFEGTSSEWAYKNEFALLIKVCRHSSSSRKANALWEPYFRCASPPRTPTVCHGHPVQSFYSQSHLSKLGLIPKGDFYVIPKSATGILAILLHPSSLKQAWTREGRGFEGTDLATLSHLEHPQSATGILCKDFSSAMLKQA